MLKIKFKCYLLMIASTTSNNNKQTSVTRLYETRKTHINKE